MVLIYITKIRPTQPVLIYIKIAKAMQMMGDKQEPQGQGKIISPTDYITRS